MGTNPTTILTPCLAPLTKEALLEYVPGNKILFPIVKPAQPAITIAEIFLPFFSISSHVSHQRHINKSERSIFIKTLKAYMQIVHCYNLLENFVFVMFKFSSNQKRNISSESFGSGKQNHVFNNAKAVRKLS